MTKRIMATIPKLLMAGTGTAAPDGGGGVGVGPDCFRAVDQE